MKYIQFFDLDWDELFQVQIENSDPVLASVPSGIRISNDPFDLPIRPRSKFLANIERHKEASSVSNGQSGDAA